MSNAEKIGAGDAEVDAVATGLRQDIAHTRAEMSATLGALEHQLDPAELREKAMIELGHVEVKVKEVLREQLLEAKTLLTSELTQAREAVKADLIIAKYHVKNELTTAFHNAKQSVRDATFGKVEDIATKAGDVMNDARDTLVDTIRQNPFPAALAGIGLAWLLMNRSQSASRRRSNYGPSDSGRREGGAGYGIRVSHALHSAENRAGQMANQVGNTLGDLAHGASDVATSAVRGVAETATRIGAQTSESAGAIAHQVVDTAGNLVHQAADTAGNIAHQAQDAAGYVAEGARAQARRLEQGFQTTLESNPVALGAAALAVGAAFGFALPRTRREDELMGAVSDQVVHRVQDTAQETLQAVQQLSEKTSEKATDALREATR